MTRKEIYLSIENKLGVVPEFLKGLPDASLQLEWELLEQVQMDEGPIPNKYRELMGVALSAATKCRYCAYFHTQFARLFGATEAEIEDAVHYAKSAAGWSTYLNGMQMDFEQFKEDVDHICEHVRAEISAHA